MTPQEQQLIDGLVDRVRSTQATDKDVDADKYLHQHLDSVPDALYVLAQTVLVQQYGLNNAQQQLQAAQQQIQDLQQQLDQSHSAAAQPPQKSGSFLSHLFGNDDPQQQRPPQPSGYQPVNTGYPPPPPSYGGPVYAQPVMMPQPMGMGFGGGGGFMRGALQTAAGVAAGEMMFQGMEDLFRGFGGEHRGYEGGGYDRPGETINNNYYGDQPGNEHHESSSTDSSFYNAANDASRQDLSPDIEDRRGFTDAGNNDAADNDQQGFADTSSPDDSSYDDGGTDDSSGFDGGGGSDDSSMGGDDGGSF